MKAFHSVLRPVDRRAREITRQKANKQKTDQISATCNWMNTNVASSLKLLSTRAKFESKVTFNKLLKKASAIQMGENCRNRSSKMAHPQRTASIRRHRWQDRLPWRLRGCVLTIAAVCLASESLQVWAASNEAIEQKFAKSRSHEIFRLNAPPSEINGELIKSRPPGGIHTRAIREATNRQGAAMQAAPMPQTTTVPMKPPNTIKNVTAQNGQSVLLHCLVEPSGSGDTAVSWFRGAGELQLLTYESSTIIQDERFVVRHGLVKDDDWALQIKNLDKATDSGLYQCQTNADPPQSQYYQLNIVEPQVHILGAPDMAVKLGAPINLTCVISQSPDQLQFIFWYRDDRMINYDMSAQRGKIVMSKLAQKADTIMSNLQIFSSQLADSGNYTCMPSGARPMSIYVHVLEAGSDKRLIMFQNDYDPSAASSQQSSSALSIHASRFWRARPLGLLLAAFIFASWYQLVVQTHTVFSLILLAIIGLFLGRVTQSEDDTGRHKRLELRARRRGSLSLSKKDAESKFTQLDRSVLGSGPGDTSAAESTTWSCSPKTASPSPVSSPSSCQLDPLIGRANSALNLLRSMNAANQEATGERGEKLATPKVAVKSSEPKPSPSVSSSSASTGYNSDHSRSAGQLNLFQPPDAKADAKRPNIGERAHLITDKADQMLELITDQVISETGINDQLRAMLLEASAEQTGPSLIATAEQRSPAKPARQVALEADDGRQPADQEPYYSSPSGAICDCQEPR